MTTDLRHQLQQSLGAAYDLEHELTGGGMSRVFIAHDRQLDRKVVVKVLSPDLAAGVNTERFKREIRVVASLQQANIVPLLSAGETNGLPFYTMPFVEGRSLRDRLTAAPLSIVDAVSILRDIARALTYAHEHGVVHRDIKPENVLLSGEAAVVTDFGIARALTRARSATGAAEATITALGTAVGTPAYMAPEQASGDPDTDHRADVYAFGCVAFELLAGRPPFHGRSVHEVITAHIAEPPPALADLRKDAPPGLIELVARCLEKNPSRRPQSARELLQGLDVDSSGTAAVRPRAAGPLRHLVITTPLVGAAIAAAFLLNARGVRDEAPSTQRALLALVPFANVDGDTAQDFRTDGLTDALQIEAKRVAGLTVAARSATNRFRDRRDLDVREVGQALNVAYVLHGTFRTDGRTQRVVARLSRTSDGADIWQDDFDHPIGEVFAAEDDIRRGVFDAIQRHLGIAGAATSGASNRGTDDTTAYNLYQRGQFLFGRRGSGVALAAQLFEQAIARDPNFARAHAGLAAALEILPNFSDTTFVEVQERATTAARRALALDSTLSEAHTALALAYMHSFQWALADSQFQVALRHDPGDPAAHMQYARLLVYSGRANEALAVFRRARELDPTSPVISGWLASTLMHNGRRREAFAEIDRALELDSMNPPLIFFGAQISIERGRLDLARRLLARTPPIAVWRGSALQGYVALGDTETVRRLLPEVVDSPARSFRHSARAIAALSQLDTTRALDEFGRAMDAGEFWPSAPILTTPFVDPVRNSGRFAELLRRANLDVSLFTSPPGARANGKSTR